MVLLAGFGVHFMWSDGIDCQLDQSDGVSVLFGLAGMAIWWQIYDGCKVCPVWLIWSERSSQLVLLAGLNVHLVWSASPDGKLDWSAHENFRLWSKKWGREDVEVLPVESGILLRLQNLEVCEGGEEEKLGGWGGLRGWYRWSDSLRGYKVNVVLPEQDHVDSNDGVHHTQQDMVPGVHDKLRKQETRSHIKYTTCHTAEGAAVVKQLEYQPPINSNQVQFPTGSLPDFRTRNRVGRCHWSADFLGDLQFPPPLQSGAAPCSPRFTLIGSQDFDINEHP
ncbi:hypothetical protein PR048_014962 [Dryococelus australis]|uniref:Uncharacterized protein n=1 Tax=Dryococelus australis TaxID=614101 RepID=A0ABQ9HFN6_9NEOP|nr:hypothetical protein PR048_014962 [Dryococelus australis]